MLCLRVTRVEDGVSASAALHSMVLDQGSATCRRDVIRIGHNRYMSVLSASDSPSRNARMDNMLKILVGRRISRVWGCSPTCALAQLYKNGEWYILLLRNTLLSYLRLLPATALKYDHVGLSV
jgi:hypothetical protein